MSLDLAGTPGAHVILDRIRGESRDESEKKSCLQANISRVNGSDMSTELEHGC